MSRTRNELPAAVELHLATRLSMGAPVSSLTPNRAVVRDAALATEFDCCRSTHLTAAIAVQMAQLLIGHQFAINVRTNILPVLVNLQEVVWARISCFHLAQPLGANVGHRTKTLFSWLMASSFVLLLLSLGGFEVPAGHHVHGDNQPTVIFEKQLLLGIKLNWLGFACGGIYCSSHQWSAMESISQQPLIIRRLNH
jgi:hypothetical protein